MPVCCTLLVCIFEKIDAFSFLTVHNVYLPFLYRSNVITNYFKSKQSLSGNTSDVSSNITLVFFVEVGLVWCTEMELL